MQRLRGGFTLIELLTVIAIIGILASIIFVSLQSAQVKGRDAQRLATLGQIRAALDQYAVDNGHFPITNSDWTGFDPNNYWYATTIVNPAATSIGTALAPYLPKVPSDPKGTAAGTQPGYVYRSDSAGSNYKLLSWLEPENMNNYPATMVDPVRCTEITNGQCSGASAGNAVGYWTVAGAAI